MGLLVSGLLAVTLLEVFGGGDDRTAAGLSGGDNPIDGNEADVTRLGCVRRGPIRINGSGKSGIWLSFGWLVSQSSCLRTRGTRLLPRCV